jgi:hypothetical protein
MFTVLGALLSVYGLVTARTPESYVRSLGLNVNLWWGLVMLAFGMIMAWMGLGGMKRPAAPAGVPEGERRPGGH